MQKPNFTVYLLQPTEFLRGQFLVGTASTTLLCTTKERKENNQAVKGSMPMNGIYLSIYNIERMGMF